MFCLEGVVRCPACKKWISTEGLNSCPICGLKDLNQIFLSENDRAQWAETVLKPHIVSGNWESAGMLLSWGRRHLLGLSGGGKLYGIGNNMSQQIKSDSEQKMFDTPVLISRQVRAAAASPHYSVFVTYDGELHMRGYAADIARRYQENKIKEKVRDVVACTSEDAFWAVTVSGKVYFWGQRYYNNELINAGLIPEYSKVEEYIFPEDVKYEKVPDEFVYGYDSYSHHSVVLYSRRGDIKYEKSMEQFQRMPKYLSLCQEYGEKNIDLEWVDSRPGFKKMRVMRTNDVIFVPERMPGSAEKLESFSLNLESMCSEPDHTIEEWKRHMKTLKE